MHINTVPARTGFHWLKLGFQMFWRQPLAWILLSSVFIACTLLLQFIPWVGPALGMALSPVLCLLMMVAAAQVFAGQRLRPAALLAALGDNRDRLHAVLALCALYAIAVLAPLMLTTLIDGGELAGYILNMDFAQRKDAALPQDVLPMLCWYAWLCVLSPVFWFAPALVHWHGVAPRKALWLSIVACLRNWRAFLVLFLSSMGILTALMVGMIVVSVTHIILIGVPQSAAMQLLMQAVGVAVCAAVALVVLVAYLASATFSLRDCFCPPDTPLATPAGAGPNAA